MEKYKWGLPEKHTNGLSKMLKPQDKLSQSSRIKEKVILTGLNNATHCIRTAWHLHKIKF